MSMEVTAIDWQVSDGYVLCEARGMIHDTAIGARELNHGLNKFFDLYDDGTLCTGADHYPVGARLPEGYEL